ncbi:hypothetical protein Pmani_011259 [Petrolisthes manimaculis]|uniref:Uncharacterized protein n=1 Tax=Petrolisthes manimaculis TaxID=1843537 RepID=A0AAE1PZL1_9EUCA|nr:hypothetical protein Pmani_011259 [Petrolisthes manimaculis]
MPCPSCLSASLPTTPRDFSGWGGTDEVENGVWTDFEGNKLNFTNFEDTYKSSKRSCLIMLVPPYNEKWDDVSCGKTYSMCVPCQEEKVKNRTVIKMRGLCEEDENAAWFTLHQDQGEAPMFKGFTRYRISTDEADEGGWELYDLWKNKTVARYPTHSSSYPLGTHTWELVSDYDICDMRSGFQRILTLSGCYPDEYTCGDGTCVDLERRCDLRVDCPDNTDEIGCDKLKKPQDYLSSLTPAGVEPGPLAMNLSLTILGFSEINLRDMMLTVNLAYTLSWFDQRLQYRNLKYFDQINHIQVDEVWTPRVEYLNADFPNVHTDGLLLTVGRRSPPEPDDPSLHSHDEIFEGAKNPLQLYRRVNAPFSCNMKLQNFPFDTQRCHLLLRLASARQDFLSYVQLNVSYMGEQLLTEYEVGEVTVQHIQEEDYSVADITITLYRRFWFYFTSTYVPTVMLMLISFASLFCKRENCDLRVMMALTTLLVLYALYQQISNGLPKTSYVKAIDVWCFFAITFIFTKVIFHVVIDVAVRVSYGVRRKRHVSIGLNQQQQQQQHRSNSKERVNSWEDEIEKIPRLSLRLPTNRSTTTTTTTNNNNKVMVMARIGYTVVFVVFAVVYWLIVLLNVDY